MPTGACGINCDMCRLNLLGICSSCGSGTEAQGLAKMTVQERVLGAPCPILDCAVRRKTAYCPRDCNDFPCDAFRNGPYPFSEGYLNMQKRRRTQPEEENPVGNAIEVPPTYWEELAERNVELICQNAEAIYRDPTGILLPFFREYLLVDYRQQTILRQVEGEWKPIRDRLLTLLCLVYLLGADAGQIKGDMVSIQELKTRHFFTGPHQLDTRPVLVRYGEDGEGFRKAAEALGGEALTLADLSYRFEPFPKVPLYCLLWQGDEEFQASLSILFDRSIEKHLAADAIWGLVKLTSRILVMGGKANVYPHSG